MPDTFPDTMLICSAQLKNIQELPVTRYRVFLWFGQLHLHLQLKDHVKIGTSMAQVEHRTELGSVNVTQQSIVTDVTNGDLTPVYFPALSPCRPEETLCSLD